MGRPKWVEIITHLKLDGKSLKTFHFRVRTPMQSPKSDLFGSTRLRKSTRVRASEYMQSVRKDLRSISEISSCFFWPRPWHIEIRHCVNKKHPQWICSDLRLSN